MPTTLPGISVTGAQALLQKQDQILKSFPGSRARLRKGRARRDVHRPGALLDDGDRRHPEARVAVADEGSLVLLLDAGLPQAARAPALARDDLLGRARERDERRPSASGPDQRLDDADQEPHRHADDGHPNARRASRSSARTSRRSSGSPASSSRSSQAVPGTRSVYGERVAGGFFVDFDLKRREIARYGLTIKEVQDVIMAAIGGENVTTTIEGRERYPVNVRYPRELRDDPDKLARTLVPTMSGAQIPLSQLADIRLVEGPSMIRDENGRLSGLRLRRRRHRQPGHRRLHRGREGGRRPVGQAAHGLSARLERPVRGHGAGPGEDAGRPAGHAVSHLRPALRQHQVPRRRRSSCCSPCPFPRSARSGCSTPSATTSRSASGSA